MDLKSELEKHLELKKQDHNVLNSYIKDSLKRGSADFIEVEKKIHALNDELSALVQQQEKWKETLSISEMRV